MRRILTFVSCWVLAMTVSSVASADLAGFWDNVEAASKQYNLGLKKGDSIRVVFTTSAVMTADSFLQADYQNFANSQVGNGSVTSTLVKSALDAPVPELADWKPLVTTALDATPGFPKTPVYDWVTDNDRPVFNTQGNLVAYKGADMLGGTLMSAISLDQSGDDQALAGNGALAVWTGTAANGKLFAISGNLYDYTLGDPDNVSIAGDGTSATNWLAAGVLPQASLPAVIPPGLPGFSFSDPQLIGRSIYVMSGEITVVPEPSTILLWLGMAGIAGVVFWRKRRS